MTMPYMPEELRANSRRMVLDLMACGIDPERAPIFIQSLVPPHTELCWILACFCSYGDLQRMTQFKEKARQVRGQQSDSVVSVGLFTYPVLQAADILVYRAQYVPVGRDQVQHLELSRGIARRFNQQFGEIFPEPQPKLTETPKLMSLADPAHKMSKSAGPKHYIGLFESESSVRQKVKAAVTDSGVPVGKRGMSPGVANSPRDPARLRQDGGGGRPDRAPAFREAQVQ
jgi:tryptophanyl-tRNA synthetase